GGGRVLIRGWARRRGAGWGRVAGLALAYGIVEEGLVLQSMFNPDLFNAGLVGGRALGVNWVWSEWTLGYHVVWGISIPILLAELLFPERRAEPWLGQTGVAVAGVFWALGALAIGAAIRFFVTPHFRTRGILLAGAMPVVVGLVGLALGWPNAPPVAPPVGPSRPNRSPWLVGLVACVAGIAWFNLLFLPTSLRSGAWVLVPMLLGLGLAAGLIILLQC